MMAMKGEGRRNLQLEDSEAYHASIYQHFPAVWWESIPDSQNDAFLATADNRWGAHLGSR